MTCTAIAVVVCLLETDADVVDCVWSEMDKLVVQRRRVFCRSVEGFVDVCRCHDPAPIVFSPAVVSIVCLRSS